MSLEKVADILLQARKNGHGVAAFNLFNFESIFWAIEAAEQENKPVIAMLYPACKSHIPFGAFAAITRDLASRASVPVGLHLDHSQSFEEILSAVSFGFTSVMIDASRLPWQENAELTAKVVEACHAMNVDVEAELGFVGQASNLEDFSNSSRYTSPEEAKRFVDTTGVDSLAVAIGSAHGNYVATPKLDMERLSAIASMTDVPLVLHGGSGIPDEQIKAAVRLGISKLNIGTELNQVFYDYTARYCEKNTQSGKRGSELGCLAGVREQMISYLRGKIGLLQP